MLPNCGSNVFEAHGFNPQSSSLMKMPRYFTVGGPCLKMSPCSARVFPLVHRHIRPPIPRRNADHFRQLVNAVNRPAPVAAGDDQRLRSRRAGDSSRFAGHNFPIAADAVRRQFSFHRQPVNDFAFPNRADDDTDFSRPLTIDFQSLVLSPSPARSHPPDRPSRAALLAHRWFQQISPGLSCHRPESNHPRRANPSM